MTHISIREQGADKDRPGPVIVIDGQEFTIHDNGAPITPPFSDAEEQRLEWYFEQHLRFPFTGQVRAQEAAQSIATYGETLFNRVFTNRLAYSRFRDAIQRGIETLTVEIAGSHTFHAIHWEALKDPDLPHPLALRATFVRRHLTPQVVQAPVRPSPTINLLIVTARPGGAQDVSYRVVSRPLINALRQARLSVQVELLRPGTYEALINHLAAVQHEHGSGYYHVIHFDVHGGLLTYDQYQQLQQQASLERLLFQNYPGEQHEITPYAGYQAYLFFESATNSKAHPVVAQELADLLIHHQIPVAILNACQSGKQVGATETSLGSQLMGAGLQTVVAMGYSVTVSAATRLMTRLYQELFAGKPLSTALRTGRLDLFNHKGRRAFFNQTVDLEDWLLPVVYENQPVQLQPRPFMPEESDAFYSRRATRYREPPVTYAFVGRDLDILNIERRLLGRNCLLVRGMGGAGKTTLLHHVAAWWQTTGWVDQVFYFGYDERAWTRQQLLDAIGRRLFGGAGFIAQLQSQSQEIQQEVIAARLRAERHLLIFDNLESITGTALAILNTLPANEQTRLHTFLRELAGGRTFVLLGSRSDEAWLAPGTFAGNVYDLPGLDPEAASDLADLILQRHHATRHRSDPAFDRLFKLLDGYPLALEVILANLAYQTPAEVLAALHAGDVKLDKSNAQDKTESIIQCIAYSHSNLDADAQQLLLCLVPFTSVLNTDWLPQYIHQLQAQPALATLPLAQLSTVVQQAVDWGLLAPYPELNGYLRIQPILPYFLKTRLQQGVPAVSAAIESAFLLHYDGIGTTLCQAIESKEPIQRDTGLSLTQVEYENLFVALQLALANRTPIRNVYLPLDLYLKTTKAVQQGITLGHTVLAVFEARQLESLTDDERFDLLRVLGDLSRRHTELKQYAEAEAAQIRAITVIDSFTQRPDQHRGLWKGTAYHQLGRVAEEQRQWQKAEAYYQQALELFIKFNHPHRQASTYHQLGIVAQEQRQWDIAETHYQKALELKIKLNDRYSQASTYGQLGTLAQKQRQWEQAENYYQQALAVYIKFNEHHRQAGIYHQLGKLAEEQHRWHQAEQHYQQALSKYLEFGDRVNQATTYHNLGKVAQKQGQQQQAEQYYQRALEWKQEFNDRYHQAGTYFQLGSLAQEQEQQQQAQHYYQQALTIYTEYDDSYHQAITYGQLALLAKEQEQLFQAQEHLLAALTIFVKSNDQHLITVTLRNLARIWGDGNLVDLPATVAPILGVTPAEVETLFTQLLDSNNS
jgi:tetratricopeptide (TPR) repeat protein